MEDKSIYESLPHYMRESIERANDRILELKDENAALELQLALTENALELTSKVIAEDTDICFWNECAKVANKYGGYDCDRCPRQPTNKCTKEWFLQQAKAGDRP